jgi:hypothetical protein
MTEKRLAKGVGCRTSSIKVYKAELEEKRLVKLLLHLNGGRSNPRHEIVKLSRPGIPICKHISAACCMDIWGELDRNALIECYLRSNWNIIPFNTHSKKPIDSFSTWDWRRTSISDKMDFFFKHPSLNVGLVVCSHLSIIDVDSKVNEWVKNENFQNTLSVSTPNGTHFYFRRDCVITTSTKTVPDIDTKCAGTYVVLPPSIHPSGQPYEWDIISKPEYIPIDFRREWQRLHFASHSTLKSFVLPDKIYEGKRNDTLWKYGRSLKCQNKTYEEIEIELNKTNDNICESPIPYGEINNLVKNVWFRSDRQALKNQ